MDFRKGGFEMLLNRCKACDRRLWPWSLWVEGEGGETVCRQCDGMLWQARLGAARKGAERLVRRAEARLLAAYEVPGPTAEKDAAYEYLRAAVALQADAELPP